MGRWGSLAAGGKSKVEHKSLGPGAEVHQEHNLADTETGNTAGEVPADRPGTAELLELVAALMGRWVAAGLQDAGDIHLGKGVLRPGHKLADAVLLHIATAAVLLGFGLLLQLELTRQLQQSKLQLF